MSAPTAPASTTVHLEIPGAQALSERTSNTHPWNACSVIAEADALHLCPWNAVALDAHTVDAWRWQYIENGQWSKNQAEGTTLKAIYWHLTQTPIHAHIAGYIPYSDSPNLTQLHTLIKAQSLLQNPIIIQVLNAQALTKAEQGVQSHFVTLAGIDSVQGYLTLNGDTLDALQTTNVIVPAYWNTWATLTRARICGAIALQRLVTPPAPPETAFDTNKALALAQELVKALGG